MSTPARRSRPAAVTRWDPFVEFEDLYSRMGQLFQSSFGDIPMQAGPAGWAPLTDVTETDDAYMVELELPGVKRDQINVELSDRQLVVSGEVKEEEKEGVRRRRARRYGRFEYRTLLPGEADADKVTASLSDGVLTVTVPKATAAKPRKVEITEK
jgi:HSP20 family protein